MINLLKSSWPLFFGLALIMVGNGLQGTLLGVRASMEGFNTAATGFMMSLYYLGFVLGSYFVPKMVCSVGHIRVFTALASLASSSVLLHGVFVDITLWSVARMITGFSYAGLYIVVESWLNNMSTNKTRGKILSIYLIVTFAGLIAGQFLLNIADPADIQLFVLTSILVSIALLPISLSSRPAPTFEEPETISFKRLLVSSPLGIACSLGTGLSAGIIFGLGAVYASEIGLSVAQIASFMAAFMFGCMAFQIPIGWLSDTYDRRLIIIAISGISSLLAIACFFTSGSPILFYLLFFALGGFSSPLYGQAIAHTNDHISERQYVAAGATLILINGVGAALGPFLVSIFMSTISVHVYFPIIAVTYGLLCIYGLYRTQKREAVPLEDQGDTMLIPRAASPVVMNIMEESVETMKKLEDKPNGNA